MSHNSGFNPSSPFPPYQPDYSGSSASSGPSRKRTAEEMEEELAKLPEKSRKVAKVAEEALAQGKALTKENTIKLLKDPDIASIGQRYLSWLVTQSLGSHTKDTKNIKAAAKAILELDEVERAHSQGKGKGKASQVAHMPEGAVYWASHLLMEEFTTANDFQKMCDSKIYTEEQLFEALLTKDTGIFEDEKLIDYLFYFAITLNRTDELNRLIPKLSGPEQEVNLTRLFSRLPYQTEDSAHRVFKYFLTRKLISFDRKVELFGEYTKGLLAVVNKAQTLGQTELPHIKLFTDVLKVILNAAVRDKDVTPHLYPSALEEFYGAYNPLLHLFHGETESAAYYIALFASIIDQALSVESKAALKIDQSMLIGARVALEMWRDGKGSGVRTFFDFDQAIENTNVTALRELCKKLETKWLAAPLPTELSPRYYQLHQISLTATFDELRILRRDLLSVAYTEEQKISQGIAPDAQRYRAAILLSARLYLFMRQLAFLPQGEQYALRGAFPILASDVTTQLEDYLHEQKEISSLHLLVNTHAGRENRNGNVVEASRLAGMIGLNMKFPLEVKQALLPFIDFGIAQLLNPPITPESTLTSNLLNAIGPVLFTPESVQMLNKVKGNISADRILQAVQAVELTQQQLFEVLAKTISDQDPAIRPALNAALTQMPDQMKIQILQQNLGQMSEDAKKFVQEQGVVQILTIGKTRMWLRANTMPEQQPNVQLLSEINKLPDYETLQPTAELMQIGGVIADQILGPIILQSNNPRALLESLSFSFYKRYINELTNSMYHDLGKILCKELHQERYKTAIGDILKYAHEDQNKKVVDPHARSFADIHRILMGKAASDEQKTYATGDDLATRKKIIQESCELKKSSWDKDSLTAYQEILEFISLINEEKLDAIANKLGVTPDEVLNRQVKAATKVFSCLRSEGSFIQRRFPYLLDLLSTVMAIFIARPGVRDHADIRPHLAQIVENLEKLSQKGFQGARFGLNHIRIVMRRRGELLIPPTVNWFVDENGYRLSEQLLSPMPPIPERPLWTESELLDFIHTYEGSFTDLAANLRALTDEEKSRLAAIFQKKYEELGLNQLKEGVRLLEEEYQKAYKVEKGTESLEGYQSPFRQHVLGYTSSQLGVYLNPNVVVEGVPEKQKKIIALMLSHILDDIKSSKQEVINTIASGLEIKKEDDIDLTQSIAHYLQRDEFSSKAEELMDSLELRFPGKLPADVKNMTLNGLISYLNHRDRRGAEIDGEIHDLLIETNACSVRVNEVIRETYRRRILNQKYIGSFLNVVRIAAVLPIVLDKYLVGELCKQDDNLGTFVHEKLYYKNLLLRALNLVPENDDLFQDPYEIWLANPKPPQAVVDDLMKKFLTTKEIIKALDNALNVAQQPDAVDKSFFSLFRDQAEKGKFEYPVNEDTYQIEMQENDWYNFLEQIKFFEKAIA